MCAMTSTSQWTCDGHIDPAFQKWGQPCTGKSTILRIPELEHMLIMQSFPLAINGQFL